MDNEVVFNPVRYLRLCLYRRKELSTGFVLVFCGGLNRFGALGDAVSSEIKIYNMDCMAAMKEMPDKAFDLILTSPPYNMGSGESLGYQPLSTVGNKFYKEYQDNKTEAEYVEWCMKVIEQCLRISRYVFWNVQFVRSTRDMILSLQENYYHRLKDIFIWEKQAVASITANRGGLAKGWEYVFMLGEDNKSIFEYNNFPKNGYVPNIKTWYKSESFKNHHATFTQEMCHYFINHFTKENDTVCDPFMGMAQTAMSCLKLNRNFIGYEIDKEYFEAAQKRIENHKKQLTFI